jgi:tetratricopeptide (TPR) repeat protein
VESVAWISGATEPLLAALLLGSLLAYMKHRDSNKTKTDRWHVTSLLLASLAVMAKETALIMPAIIFTYDWIFGQHDARKIRLWSAVRAAVPFGFISAGFLILRTVALKSVAPPRAASGLGPVVLAWPEVVEFYSAHTLFPVRLSVFYKLFTVSSPGLRNFGLPLMLVLAVAAVLCYASRRSRALTFLSAWYAIMMVPILNVTLWSNAENVHDRYLYLPSAALCLMLASLLSRMRALGYCKTALAALIAIAVGYGFVTVRELQYWSDDYVLGQHGMSVSPGHPLAPQLVGNLYIRQQRVPEAIPYLVDALNAQPDNVTTLCSLGFCYAEVGALRLAEECITKALRVDGAEPRAHLVLGIVRFKQQRLDEAETEFRRGIELQHVSTGILLLHYYLGNVLYAKGNVQGARYEYQLELRNDPAIDPAFDAAQTQIGLIERLLQLKIQR